MALKVGVILGKRLQLSTLSTKERISVTNVYIVNIIKVKRIAFM